jgi:hypothetical protein
MKLLPLPVFCVERRASVAKKAIRVAIRCERVPGNGQTVNAER